MDTAQRNVAGKCAFSIPEFCSEHSISRATFYNLRKDGKAPVVMQVNGRILISRESAEAWRRSMEQGEHAAA
jgi:predicted site-specific integrase-resolvase